MAVDLLPRIWASGERSWSNPESCDDPNTLEGFNIWHPYIGTLRERTK